MRYGFIGLGNLGGKLAASLVRAGFDLSVHDLCAERAAPLLAAGATMGGDAQALAADSRTPSSPACRHRRFPSACSTGREGVLAGSKPGATWIEMSTNRSRHDRATRRRSPRSAASRRWKRR